MAAKCKFGKLKNPVGRRRCKKRAGTGLRKARRSRSSKSKVAKQEAAMWKSYKSGSVAGYRRRRRR